MADILPILDEVSHIKPFGSYMGNCKWFNKNLGYGFVTVIDGDMIGTDIFVHHSGIKPLNSNFKTLKKGEYIHFNVTSGSNGMQAIDVTGIMGGPLMCDNITPTVRHSARFAGSLRPEEEFPVTTTTTSDGLTVPPLN
jgi:cold shock CspA family protein